MRSRSVRPEQLRRSGIPSVAGHSRSKRVLAPRSFYDFPALYDAIHLADTPGETRVVMDIIARHGNGGRQWLEPACGSGRHLSFLAELGFQVTGYDLNERALAFARRRLQGTSAKLERAAMEAFLARNAFDAAFCLIGTFRHLATDASALKHLRLTARALRPGGVYVVGLDLADYGQAQPDEEGWEVKHRGRRLKHLLMTLPPDRRRRREKVVNFVTIETRRGDRVLQDEYDLRSYDVVQWKALIAKSAFRLVATYTQEGQRAPLDKKTRYALFALKKMHATT